MSKSVSIAKPNDHAPNEDAVFCSPQCIAVSDGAGGCGLYADEVVVVSDRASAKGCSALFVHRVGRMG